VLASVGGLVEIHHAGDIVARRRRRCQRIDHLRVARRDGDVRLDDPGKTIGELIPGRAPVGGFEDAVGRATESASFDEALLLLPEHRVDDVRIRRIDAHVIAAGVFVLIENFLEGLSAVGGAEYPALLVWPVRMAERGDEQAIGICWIDIDVGDHLAVAEPEVRPRFSRIGGLVDAVAGGEIGSNDSRAAAYIDDVRIGRGDCDCADRSRRLIVEEREPVGAEVGRAPDSAVVEGDVKGVWLRRYAGDGTSSARPKRSNVPPMHLNGWIGERLRVNRGCEGR